MFNVGVIPQETDRFYKLEKAFRTLKVVRLLQTRSNLEQRETPILTDN